jgi:hypothetical protein
MANRDRPLDDHRLQTALSGFGRPLPDPSFRRQQQDRKIPACPLQSARRIQGRSQHGLLRLRQQNFISERNRQFRRNALHPLHSEHLRFHEPVDFNLGIPFSIPFALAPFCRRHSQGRSGLRRHQRTNGRG